MNRRPPTSRFHARPRRRGGIYITVLISAMLVTVIGVSALLAVRVHHRRAAADREALQARRHAEAAIELSRYWILFDDDWRESVSDGTWIGEQPIGDGTLTVRVEDFRDGDPLDDWADPVMIFGTGRLGDARYIHRVRFESRRSGGGYRHAVLDRAPVAYWPLQDPSGSPEAADVTGRIAGDYRNGPDRHQLDARFSEPTPLFDGTDDHVAIPHSRRFEVPNGTIAFWFRAEDPAVTQGVFSKDASGFGDGGHLHVELTGGQVHARIQSSATSYELYASSVRAGRWHHAAVTFGRDGFHLYLDGNREDSDSYDGGIRANREPIALAAGTTQSGEASLTGWNAPLAGRLIHVALFDHALDPHDVEDLHEAGAPSWQLEPAPGGMRRSVD